MFLSKAIAMALLTKMCFDRSAPFKLKVRIRTSSPIFTESPYASNRGNRYQFGNQTRIADFKTGYYDVELYGDVKFRRGLLPTCGTHQNPWNLVMVRPLYLFVEKLGSSLTLKLPLLLMLRMIKIVFLTRFHSFSVFCRLPWGRRYRMPQKRTRSCVPEQSKGHVQEV